MARNSEIDSKPTEADLSSYGLSAQSGELLELKQNKQVLPELAAGLFEGAVAKPVKALAQLGGSDAKNENSQDKSAARQVGEIAGTALPYLAVSFATHKVSGSLFPVAEKSVMRSATEQAVAGFSLGSLLTPSDLSHGKNLLQARLEQGFTDAAIFASMGASSNFISRGFGEAQSMYGLVGQRAAVGVGSGLFGGFTDAELRSNFKATPYDLALTMTGYAAMGVAFEGAGLALRTNLSSGFGKSLKGEVNYASATELMSADPKATFISNFAGWYDNLQRAIRTAPPNHTIVLKEDSWGREAAQMMKSLKRSDIKIVVDKNIETTAARSADKTVINDSKKETVAAEPVDIKGLPQWELSKLVRNEASANGVNPVDAIIESLKKNRMVMVGEYHVEGSAHNEWGRDVLIPQLKGKVTHFAIEEGTDLRLFKADGKVNFDALPNVHQHREYSSMLQAAKDAGMKISPVDVPDGQSRDLLNRNKFMTKELLAILKDKDAKVLFWVGNKHLRTVDSGDGPQVVSMLRDKGVSVASYYGQHDNFWREEPMRRMFTPSTPLAVPVKESPVISRLNWLHPEEEGHGVHSFSEFDFLIMHPERRAYHFD